MRNPPSIESVFCIHCNGKLACSLHNNLWKRCPIKNSYKSYLIFSEDLRLLIAPDAATLISQGDSLVLETHGRQGSISRLVMRTQIILREQFREVQQARYDRI